MRKKRNIFQIPIKQSCSIIGKEFEFFYAAVYMTYTIVHPQGSNAKIYYRKLITSLKIQLRQLPLIDGNNALEFFVQFCILHTYFYVHHK